VQSLAVAASGAAEGTDGIPLFVEEMTKDFFVPDDDVPPPGVTVMPLR
jgi:hypothetical protein